MSLKLSKRMMKIVELCDTCDTIIDVGTDHGKVPITIANLNLAKNVIAIDNKRGPLKACEENANLYLTNSNASFSTLLSEGLTKVDKDIECGIIITGIGYDNMCEILSDINERNFKYLILSPHTKIDSLIEFLTNIGLKVETHVEMDEDKKHYHILKVIK